MNNNAQFSSVPEEVTKRRHLVSVMYTMMLVIILISFAFTYYSRQQRLTKENM